MRLWSGCLLAALVLGIFSGCGKESGSGSPAGEESFMRLMVVGKSQYEGGDTEAAIETFRRAVAMYPNNEAALLNLANAYRMAGDNGKVIATAENVLALNPGSAAAHYLIGVAELRSQNYQDALKHLQTAEAIAPRGGDPADLNALIYQIGLAYFGLGKWEEAIARFEELTAFAPEHPAAWYKLSQALMRAGRPEEARQMAEQHQQVLALKPNAVTDADALERCRFTQARVPFKLSQPDSQGIAVHFEDATDAVLGAAASDLRAPVAVLDINHRGQSDIFAFGADGAFHLLVNSNGVFAPRGEPFAGHPEGHYFKALVGDLQNDGYEDVVVLGFPTVHLFKFATNGVFTEQTAFTGLDGVAGVDGLLMDLNSDGNLDLTVLQTNRNSIKLYENLGPPYFVDQTATSGIPATLPTVSAMGFDDWNGDDLMDVVLGHSDSPPTLLIKQRGGPLVPTNAPAEWQPAPHFALGDLNNNLRPDFVEASEFQINVLFSRLPESHQLDLTQTNPPIVHLVDYDNDGWLDLLAAGKGIRLWRNRGRRGFLETTETLGLATITNIVHAVTSADFDGDCDLDLLIATESGLRFLRNVGGNSNHLLKIRLDGQRSNRSGLGVKLLASAGNWHTARTVKDLPIEIGVGSSEVVDSLDIRWFDASDPQTQLETKSCTQWTIVEITLPTGSCPYLYRWDGERFTFVTDLLGASPLGLPVSPHRYVEADPEEYVWIGDASSFPPRDGYHVLQLTEELREVLYLDAARLVAVDHPESIEVHSTSKLVPGKPWPRHEIIALHHEHPLKKAVTNLGRDVTAALRRVDRKMVSPPELRIPQLRGLAKPHYIDLDFGPLDPQRPLVLVMNGWLRFGGGMANIAGSLRPELPFPFPTLEAETTAGSWEKVDVVIGAPAGKTKTIVTDLSGKLPAGTRRLRLRTAYEIHWDRIAMLEKAEGSEVRTTRLLPDRTDLHWRGFSEFRELPWDRPLTPDYERVRNQPNWVITPSGWCTRYGPVDDLLAASDNALVLLNGGDELTLEFNADRLPHLPPGYRRDFFLHDIGWDKDADFHVAEGWTVEPLPWHGMDDQHYGEQPRPNHLDDSWITRYNTRWIGPQTFAKYPDRETP